MNRREQRRRQERLEYEHQHPVLAFRVSAELKARVVRVAAARGVGPSDLLRELLAHLPDTDAPECASVEDVTVGRDEPSVG